MKAIKRLEASEVFGDYLFARAEGRNYHVPDGWYPLLGLAGSLDIEQDAVLFCTLQAPIETEARKFCLNGVIEKLRIHRSARVNGPDTVLVLASDLMREFELCQIPIVSTAREFARLLSHETRTDVPAEKREAYFSTRYWFGKGAEAITLRIDHRSDALARLYASSGYDCGAFVTAHNPFGNVESGDANDAAQALLGEE